MKTFIDKMDYAVKNWWLSLLVGLLYIIVAIYLMFAPLASYVALSILFSVSMFVSGLFEIAFALANKKGISSWGWYLAGGIIDLILGIFLMASPGLSMEVLPFVLAFWLMFRGFSATGYHPAIHFRIVVHFFQSDFFFFFPIIITDEERSHLVVSIAY